MVAAADTSLLLKQLEKRRVSLAMSKAAVARRAGVSRPTVNRILSGAERRPGIEHVQRIATALGVEVRLGPQSSVHEVFNAFDFRKLRAHEKARQLMRMVQGTMALEAQAVDNAVIDQLVEETACKLIAGSSRRLWED